MIYIVKVNENGKVEFTEEELQELIKKIEEDTLKNNKPEYIPIYIDKSNWWHEPPNYYPYITCDITTAVN